VGRDADGKRFVHHSGEASVRLLSKENRMSGVPAELNPLRRSRLLASTLLSAAVLTAAPAAAQDPLLLTIDQAEIIRIARPADTVIIGNPSIADATIRDNQTLILTGRSYGTTNLIVLDADGQPIADELVTVQAVEQSVVTVFKRSARQTFSCAPLCEPTLNVGDELTGFQTINEQLQARSALAR
jgi:Flp pilus assembly secretin CpaC